MDKHAISIKEKLTVYTSSNTVTLPSSEHNKVYIWGYELCKGSDWNNFLEVVNKLGEENQQLKEKLADIEESARAVIDANFKIAEERDKLKQQLAEKDKEIENLKDNWNLICDYLGDCVVKYDDEDVNGIYSEILSKVNEIRKYDYKYNQDKISFAVEQLTLFKNSIVNKMNNPYSVNIKHILSDFDNQIKSLKGRNLK